MDTSHNSLIVAGMVDSPLKLQLLLLFYRHPRLCGEARHLTDWLRESPWAIEEALDALAEIGLVAQIVEQGCIQYCMEFNAALQSRLDELVLCYDDPLRRDEIYAQVREADRERQFRAWIAAEEQPMLYAVW